MGPKKIRFTTATLILCFFVILVVFLSSPPAVFGRNLSSFPTGSSGNSKIGVGPGHSSTAPSSIGQNPPGIVVCSSYARYSNCLPTYGTKSRPCAISHRCDRNNMEIFY